MSVTAPRGFRAAGVTTGADGARDLALVVNDGPSRAAGAVSTTAEDPAAPVLWSNQVVSGGRVRAVVVDTGAIDPAPGPAGFQAVHALAERTADALSDSAAEIVVCAAGRPGVRPDGDTLRQGVADAVTEAARGGGLPAADALRTTDTVAKFAFQRGEDLTVGGMAKGPDAALSTGLCVLTTDAALTPEQCRTLVGAVAARTLAPLTGPGDTVVLLASGAADTTTDDETVAALLTKVCEDLAAQIAADTPTTEDEQAHT
ncbi:bifunctional ornithine acetyltransferase/N-acetylglutamate synthase [Nocardiopsis sp. HNM0947]|uniref:Bifunctional ornithine acetyltransferase/N-acetylglutamate synthase n=1 Tax=Nocardiopsis coralli TaxID=2772213 RepID=A0ABR9PEH4_9ACTN|nr:bifunctional ornithine acetyltransferase/N-acetylglutamate synthase [Nocardiopsis coralli]MBE3002222.1 bifunctional ornithine acetyltransferase/N-acetylglutamate synthase [Nocardiopsis coralli]